MAVSAAQVRKKIETVICTIILAVLLAILLLVIGSRRMEAPVEADAAPEDSPEVIVDGPTWTTILDADGSPIPSDDE